MTVKSRGRGITSDDLGGIYRGGIEEDDDLDDELDLDDDEGDEGDDFSRAVEALALVRNSAAQGRGRRQLLPRHRRRLRRGEGRRRDGDGRRRP
jgi:hypothetical protein